MQMVVNHNRDHPEQWKKLFVFDEFDERWSDDDEEHLCKAPGDIAMAPLGFVAVNRDYVLLDWRSTVVGSRKISDVTRRAMRNLFCTTAADLFRCRKFLLSPYDEWVAEMLYDNSKRRCGPDPPAGYPEDPPEREGDGNPFPWMFV